MAHGSRDSELSRSSRPGLRLSALSFLAAESFLLLHPGIHISEWLISLLCMGGVPAALYQLPPQGIESKAKEIANLWGVGMLYLLYLPVALLLYFRPLTDDALYFPPYIIFVILGMLLTLAYGLLYMLIWGVSSFLVSRREKTASAANPIQAVLPTQGLPDAHRLP